MTVKRVTGTTISLAALFVGIVFLFPIIMRVLPYKALYPLDERVCSYYSLGGFYPFFIKAAICIIIGAGILDAILRRRVALGLLSSLSVPIVLCIPIVITALIPRANFYMFWLVMQIAVIIGVYWTFRKITYNNYSGGRKLIPFIKGIKNSGSTRNAHVIDHFVVWGVSLLLLIVCIIVIVAFIVFIATHWGKFV